MSRLPVYAELARLMVSGKASFVEASDSRKVLMHAGKFYVCRPFGGSWKTLYCSSDRPNAQND